LALFFTLNETSSLPLMAPLCVLVFPALAWGAGYLSIGALGDSGRSPRLGAAVCLVSDLLLCALFSISFVADHLG
jgi:hypothetical protein